MVSPQNRHRPQAQLYTSQDWVSRLHSLGKVIFVGKMSWTQEQFINFLTSGFSVRASAANNSVLPSASLLSTWISFDLVYMWSEIIQWGQDGDSCFLHNENHDENLMDGSWLSLWQQRYLIPKHCHWYSRHFTENTLSFKCNFSIN